MKRICMIACLAVGLSVVAGEPQVGDTREQVLKVMGEPDGQAMSGQQEILFYKDGRITLKDGRVEIVNLKKTNNSKGKSQSVLGSSKAGCVAKYGAADTNASVVARNKYSPLISLPGTETQSYKVNDRWKARVGFLNGVAQRMDYEKSYQPGEAYKVQPAEFNAILNTQADGMTWKKDITPNLQTILFGGLVAPNGVWMRSDGVIAYERGLSVRIETKVVLEAEAREKQRKEQAWKQSIPKL